MQDLAKAVLVHGSLGAAYGFLTLTYLILRRKAQRDSASRSINELPWWKSYRRGLCAVMFIGAFIWTVSTADLFPRIVSSLKEICPSLITKNECSHVADNWQWICVGLAESTVAVIFVINRVIYDEARSRESTAEGTYRLELLFCSHCLLAISWFLCVPLTHPVDLFGLVGKRHWTVASSALAFFAVLAFEFGTALWIVALVKVIYAWRCASWRWPTTGALRAGGSNTEIALRNI